MSSEVGMNELYKKIESQIDALKYEEQRLNREAQNNHMQADLTKKHRFVLERILNDFKQGNGDAS